MSDDTATPEITRAPKGAGKRARTREAATPPPFMVAGVRIPPGAEARRTPLVCVDIDLGPVRATVTVAALQKGGIVVRPPQAGDGEPGVRLADDLEPSVARAVLQAVNDHPEARALLLSRHRR